MNSFQRIILVGLLATTCIANSVVYMRVHRPVIEEQLSLLPRSRRPHQDASHPVFKRVDVRR